MKNAITDLFKSEKGVLSLLVLLGIALCGFTHQLTWKEACMDWIYALAIYTGGKTIQGTFGGKPIDLEKVAAAVTSHLGSPSVAGIITDIAKTAVADLTAPATPATPAPTPATPEEKK